MIKFLQELAIAKFCFLENNETENNSISSSYVSKSNNKIFQKQEDELANKLKKICNKDGNEKFPQQSAEIFHQLGQIYFQRNTMVSLIRSATLLNAAITRKPNNLQIIKNDLKKLCSRILKEAGAKQLGADLIGFAGEVEKKVKTMRNEVNQKLCTLKTSETINKTKEEIENLKIKTIRNLQENISCDYIEIMAKILIYCQTVMGNAPCSFALIGMGSLARKEITPYSDFEHIIVLEENCQQKPDYDKVLDYFRWLSVIFQIVLINLQETIVPSVDIESFKATKNGKRENWFYDGITTRGISFDDMMPHACKFPLGQKGLSNETKQYKTELIKPVNEMLKYLASHKDLKNGYHLKDILTKVCYVGGDKTIFDSFQTKVFELLDNQNQDEKKREIKKMLIEDLDNFATRSNFLKHANKAFNIKKDFYRSTTIFISALGQVENIHASSCFDIIEALAEKKIINDKLKSKLMYAVAIACQLRLTRYMKQKRQDDEIKSIKSYQDAVQTLLKSIKETDLISYFQIAYALQCDVSKQFDLKKVHFYSDPKLLNYRLYYCLGHFENFVQFAKENKAKQYSPISRLQSAEEILVQLEKKTKHDHKQTKITAWDYNYVLQKSNVEIIYYFGLDIRLAKNNDDAKEIFEELLELITFTNKQIKNKAGKANSPNNKIDKKKYKLQILQQISYCCMDLQKPDDALNYLQQLLKIKEKASLDIGSDTNVASTLNNIGNCFINMHKPAYALDYLQRSLKIYEKTSLDIGSDTNVAMTLNNIGLCFINIHKPADALDYLQRSLKIYEKASLDIGSDTNVAMTLNNIGLCFINIHKPADALDYLQRSLKIYEKASLDIGSDTNVAMTLNNIGKCFRNIHKPADALDYLQRSLKIYEKASLDIGSDTNVAMMLNNIGLCFINMHKPADALDYLQRLLKIKEKTSLDIGSDTNVASTLHNISLCFMDIHKPADALDYLQRLLKIYEKTSLDIGSDTNVASTLNNIGSCFRNMHKPADALDYLQQSLKIYEKASLDIGSDTNVAMTLNNIGKCFRNMHKPADALNYLQRSLKIYEKASLDIGSDTNVASTLNNIGNCFINMHKPADALNYLQRSLKIYEKASLDIGSDTNVASTLNNIGNCFRNMHKPADALDYLQRSLKIYEKTSLDIGSDTNVAMTLNNIGNCFMDMHKPADALNYL